MFRKTMIATGFAAGYVLGAKAGRERYDQIMSKVDDFLGKPTVREATDTLRSSATEISDTVKSAATDTVNAAASKATDKVAETVGKTTGSGSTRSTSSTGDPYPTGTAIGTAPIAGAVASDSAL